MNHKFESWRGKAWVRSWKNLSAASAGLAMRRGPSGKRRRAERERGNGVSNGAITDTLRRLKAAVGDKMILAAGKMHASGIPSEAGEHIVTARDVEEFIGAGADIVLFPAPGTVPGITMEYVRSLVKEAHSRGVLTMTSIGTSQEGADTETIRQIALMCKMAGTDIHHLGDSGYTGMALPENILAYSKAIRGARHAYRRMAYSVNR